MLERKASKPAQLRNKGLRNAIVIFSRFQGESPMQIQVPGWAEGVFDPERPGSFSHFYETMSFGRLKVRGEIAPRYYESEQAASAYLSESPTEPGDFGQFSLEILRRVDAEVNFSHFDNDGSDGIPNSGDDDGFVDAVFIVTASVPQNFLLGPATGVGNLGLEENFVTNDTGIDGEPIRISRDLGTIQRGRTFTEAVGTMCHEYGHVLGLPDLFNTDFLQKEEALPEEDSAGIGAWGLMGWGALGWNGDDGPNSLCAWSRVALGWTEVVEVVAPEQEIRMEPVGAGGKVIKVPLTEQEYFLIEYRTRTGTYYDRHIPGEGLLIWHISWKPSEGRRPARVLVDLECADGRWLDAGYPLGRQPDSRHGGDNLDFWAHDPAYAEQYGGNLGDSTDPFDGMQYQRFTPDTNPDAYSDDGQLSAHIENIRFEKGVAIADIQTRPLLINVRDLFLSDLDGNQITVSGEELIVAFKLINNGGYQARDLRVELHSDDPWIEIVQPEARFGDLSVGKETTATGEEGFPRFRFTNDFIGTHTATLFLDIYASNTSVARHEFTVSGISPRMEVQEVDVLDSQGNGPGRAQSGGFIRLGLTMDIKRPEVLQFFSFHLRPLNEKVTQVGSSEIHFDLDGKAARSRNSPEFLLPSNLEPGTLLSFEFEIGSKFSTWKDTLFVELQPGLDQTPPRFTGFLQTRLQEEGVAICLPKRQVLDGSAIQLAAVSYSIKDTTELAVIPMHLQVDHYKGIWSMAQPGTYLMAGVAEDLAGNQNRSPLQELFVPVQEVKGESTSPGSWELLGPPGEHWYGGVHSIGISPSNPNVLYAATLTRLWRSMDGGASWTQTGLMFSGDYTAQQNRILVDAQTPSTVYLSTEFLRSLDGGRTWEKMVNPTLEDEVFLIAADPVRSRRVYAKSQEHLWISEDGGKSWNKTEVELGDENENWFFVHPAEPQVAYGYSRGVLFRSSDEGKTWARQVIAREFLGIAPDSRDADFLYAIDKNAIWHSADSGHTWREVGDVPPVDHPAEFRVLISHPAQGELLYTWTFSSEIWRSTDGGVHWESMGLDNAIREFIPHPHDPQQAFLAVSSTMGDQPFYHTQNGGEQWEPMDLPEDIAAPVGTIAFNRDGQIYVGSERNVREKNARLPQVGVFISKDGGHSWEWYAAREVRVHGALDVLLIDSIQPQIMIGHKGGGYLRSVDAGRTWNQIEALAAKYFPISRYPDMVINPHEPGVYYVVSSRSIYRSTDLGKTWEQRGEEFPYRIDGLALDPDDTQTLYMALADRVWRSEDAGMNWEESEVVAPGASIFAIAIQPLDSRLYAATTGGLYVSQNQGRTWTLLVQPREGGWSAGRIRFDPHNSENIFLVTSRQLLETRDAGKSWKSIGDDISSYPWFSDVAVDPSDSSLIYVATPWGVYRLDTRQVHTVVDEDDQTLPGTFALEPNYPNPFNPQTTISYQVPQTVLIRLTLYNMAGQVVRRLVNQVQPAGRHQVTWNGRDDMGREVNSGVYLYRLEAGPFRQTRRLVLLK